MRPYGEIRFDAHHRIKDFCEKPSQRRRGTINRGVYLFNRAIAAHFPAQEVFSLERDVFPRCKELFFRQWCSGCISAHRKVLHGPNASSDNRRKTLRKTTIQKWDRTDTNTLRTVFSLPRH